MITPRLWQAWLCRAFVLLTVLTLSSTASAAGLSQQLLPNGHVLIGASGARRLSAHVSGRTTFDGAESLCSLPKPGFASCLGAVMRVDAPIGSVQPTPYPTSVTPLMLHQLYSIPDDSVIPQTVAVVAAYNDPNLQSDLDEYSAYYDLPVCTEMNGCLAILNQRGQRAPLAPNDNGQKDNWDGEISMDVEAVHATCQNCKIVVVEANSDAMRNMVAAARTAKYLPGVTEISNSYGTPITRPMAMVSAYDTPGIVSVAASGDAAYGAFGSLTADRAEYPAADTHVIAAGATTFNRSVKGTLSQAIWGGTVSGCSPWTEMSFQAQVTDTIANLPCQGDRIINDVAVDGDPATGLAVYDSEPNGDDIPSDWMQEGGTSMASPIIAAMFALAGGAQGAVYPASILYHNYLSDRSDFGEVRSAASTGCFDDALCLPNGSYSAATGLGYPTSLAAFENPYDTQPVAATPDPNRTRTRVPSAVYKPMRVSLHSSPGIAGASIVNDPRRHRVQLNSSCSSDGSQTVVCLDQLAVAYTTDAGVYHAHSLTPSPTLVTENGRYMESTYKQLFRGTPARKIAFFTVALEQAYVKRTVYPRSHSLIGFSHGKVTVSRYTVRLSHGLLTQSSAALHTTGKGGLVLFFTDPSVLTYAPDRCAESYACLHHSKP